MTRPNLYGMSRAELSGHFSSQGAPAYHAAQAFRWMYARGRLDPRAWSDLPKALRAQLTVGARIDVPKIRSRVEARDGTIKYAIDLPGGGTVESVFMIQRERITLCLSSQVGCALGCDFCLTARMGLVRHLTAGEIVGQVAAIREDRDLPGPFNVVFMGMGEPLHNYDAVVDAFRILVDPDGFGLGKKRVTISTSGLAPAIERLAGEPERPRLAVSLNASSDAERDRLMPVNRRYPMARLLEACRKFAAATGEKFTFEYVLLAGINDTDADVLRLMKILRSHPAKLNLIPFNEVPGWLAYRAPSRARIVEIRDRLLAAGLPVSIRWSRGAEARAACGQLALLPDRPDEVSS
ncbi:MAG TPA: 23S rRNA (adenine(2503)-C(2))-methyltransferase RlmN [Candidatus Polarisedimenticolaceae bacterium]|nr:23S rRNA (adenine(2503)-C(2))-methyltransferase RlmN [Candidatus Polarisedimenticolaceae bacterium]